MTQPDIRNAQLINVGRIAISRLSRFPSVDEQQISQTFLFRADEFCGIRFDAGLFQAQWLFGNSNIEFSRGAQLIDQVPLGEIDSSRKAA